MTDGTYKAPPYVFASTVPAVRAVPAIGLVSAAAQEEGVSAQMIEMQSRDVATSPGMPGGAPGPAGGDGHAVVASSSTVPSTVPRPVAVPEGGGVPEGE